MDVLTGYALGIHLHGEQDCIVQLLETLGAERAKQARKLRKLVQNTDSPLRRRMKQTLSKLDKLLEQAHHKKVDSPAASARASAARISRKLHAPGRLDRENLHSYRLEVKRLRYILQLADHANQWQLLDMLDAVKDAIGEWHDWEELIAIATDMLHHGKKCKLLPKLKSISAAKYARALSLANELKNTDFAATIPHRAYADRSSKPKVKSIAQLAVSAASA